MHEILNTYDRKKKTYEAYAKSLEALLGNLLSHNDVRVHSISVRVKEKDSLSGKIDSKDHYSCLEDITDIVGIRIITYYSDEVDLIAKIIENEFYIDKKNSTDKRKTIAHDRFGYLSLHYIISLKNERVLLTEYSRFKDLKAELQIRSILQHTWAEIEHDIGYKSGIGVPNEIKRQFSRLAGLLELGDSEFINIRDKLKQYAFKVEQDVKNNVPGVPLDKVSLQEYMKASKVINEIAITVKDKFNLTLTEGTTYLNFTLENLEYVNIKTITELDNHMIENKKYIIKKCGIVAERVMKKRGGDSIMAMLIFVYLAQRLIVKTGGREAITKYISKFSSMDREASEVIDELMITFE
jgi:ppGpp synthetase/RelA/SpoT-type nucleotidyltranferase